MQRKKEHGCLPFSAHVRIGYVVGCMLVLALIGCQHPKPSLNYLSLLDHPVQSRTQTASLSKKSAETLIQEGFIKIGSLNGNILKITCRHYFVGGQDIPDDCTTYPDADPVPLLLEKGREMGGDLVVIEFEKPYTEIMNMMAKDGYYEKEFSAITVAVCRKDG